MAKNDKNYIGELDLKELEEMKKTPISTNTEDEKKLLDYIIKRMEDMKAWRRSVDGDWQIYQDMIDAIFYEYPDERSSSVVPLASSMIELYVADAIKIKTDFRFRGENKESKTSAKVMEKVWKYDRRINKRQRVFNDAEYTAWWFGTQVMYSWYEINEFIQKDLKVWEDGMPTREDRTIKEENIILEDVRLQDIYFDNRNVWSIDSCSDAGRYAMISFEKFQLLKWNPYYRNIEKVTPISYTNDYSKMIIKEERGKEWEFVKLLFYHNVDKDMFVIVANDAHIIRAHPMISTINGKKALPYSIRVLGKKNYSLYGRGLCEACLMFNSEINNLREQMADAIRRSNQQVLAIGNGLKFNGRKFSYDNEILTFDWPFAGNFQQISWNPPNQAIFSYIERVYKDIALYVWIDIQNLLGDANQTAYQTEVQREASQKRINLWLTNRDLAYERIADLHKDNLKKFFPKKDAEWLFKKIESEDEKYDANSKKFIKSKGTHLFEVTPEMLEDDIYTDVFTTSSVPTIDAVKKEEMRILSRDIAGLANNIATARAAGVELDDVLPVKKLVKEMVDIHNLNIMEDENHEELEAKKQEFMQQLMQMQQWANRPSLSPNMQQWAEPNMWQSPKTSEMQWVPEMSQVWAM